MDIGTVNNKKIMFCPCPTQFSKLIYLKNITKKDRDITLASLSENYLKFKSF